MPLFVFLIDDLRFADSELIAFPAHCLDQDGEMQLAAAGNLKAIGRVGVFHAKTDIGIKLAS